MTSPQKLPKPRKFKTLEEALEAFPQFANVKVKEANRAITNEDRRRVLEFARANGFITNPAGYEFYLTSWRMYGHCACDETRPECPCPEAPGEVAKNGWCKCRLYWSSLQQFLDTNLPVEEKQDA